MSLFLRVNGITYENFTSAEVIRSIETAATAFSFASSANEDNLFPIKKGDRVEVIADDYLISTGYVERVKVSYDSQSHTIEINGRSLLLDLLDSTVGATKEFTGQVSLIDIARSVLDDLGLSEVEVINNAGSIPNFNADDITSAETGQGAFDFIESYARKRQVLINTDPEGNLVFARASSELSPLSLKMLVSVGNKGNNVIAGSLDLSTESLFNQYIAQSQLNPVKLGDGTTPADIADQVGEAIDNTVRPSRRFEFYVEESTDTFTLKDRAAWEANIRIARAEIASLVVQGHTENGNLWEPNKLYKVDDDFLDIHSELLASQVTYRYDIEGGSTTTISLTNKDAYTLKVEQDAREALTNEFGGGF
jgi:prophage tail gpP-like protein